MRRDLGSGVARLGNGLSFIYVSPTPSSLLFQKKNNNNLHALHVFGTVIKESNRDCEYQVFLFYKQK